jgi:polyphosphate glucokinase
MNALGIDIGGSAVKGAPVDTRTGRLLAPRLKIETPEKLTPAKLAGVVAQVTAHFQWRGPVGIGFPGVIHGHFIRTSANLHPRFVGTQGVRLFARATRCRVALLNDAAAAGLAELKFGGGHGFAGKTLMLTLGTGVGSALVLDGVVFPVELGHLPMKGRSAEKRVSSAARKRNDLSWRQWSKRLNEYLGVLETIIRPELIVIGGGVSAKHRKFFPFLRTTARLVPAKLGNDAGIVGAALRAVQAAEK